MAEETPKPIATVETESKPTEEIAAAAEPQKVTLTVEKEAAEPEPVAVPESDAEAVAVPCKEEEVAEAEVPEAPGGDDKITQSVSFKEETNVVSELPENERKALEELKLLIQKEITPERHGVISPPPPPPHSNILDKKEEVEEEKKKEEVEVAEEKKEEVEVAEEKKEEVVVIVEEEKGAPSTEEVNAVDEKPKEEAPKEVTPSPIETKEDEKVVPPPPEAAVTEVVEKASAVLEDDGAKTDEAIEETVDAISTTEATGESSTAKEEEKAAVVEEPKVEEEAVPPPAPEEFNIWGIPLLEDERTDVVLLKFLRARDFKVNDAFKMIKDTARWRKEFGIDALLDEDLGSDWDKVVFTNGFDKEGHPVCYNVFGPFDDKELYQNTFGDEAKRSKFLKWRIQFLEKSVRNLDFSPTGVNTIFQVNDFKNLPVFGIGKREFRLATNRALQLFQDNYPELVAKQVFINVPWWYLAFNTMISPFLTQRTKSKFVHAGPTKTAETLFKYIAAEQVPVQYGGLERESEQEFTTEDAVTEITIKPSAKEEVEIPIAEKGLVVWEVRVLGWDLIYGAEFVPSVENGYTVVVQKKRKIGAVDETVMSNSFKVCEPGKLVLSFDNLASKKKKLLLYRSKLVKPISDLEKDIHA